MRSRRWCPNLNDFADCEVRFRRCQSAESRLSNLRTRQIRTVPNWLIACGLIALLVAVPGLSGADSVLPLPQGVAGTRGPTPVRMGGSMLQIESFATAIDQREVRMFYRRTLPSAGWRVDPPPRQGADGA